MILCQQLRLCEDTFAYTRLDAREDVECCVAGVSGVVLTKAQCCEAAADDES